MTKSVYYVPNVVGRRWSLVSKATIEVERHRTLKTFAQTEVALVSLDADLEKIEQELLGVWADASLQVVQAFERRHRVVQIERRKLERIRKRLREALEVLNMYVDKGVVV